MQYFCLFLFAYNYFHLRKFCIIPLWYSMLFIFFSAPFIENWGKVSNVVSLLLHVVHPLLSSSIWVTDVLRDLKEPIITGTRQILYHPVFYSLILFFTSYSSFLQLESLVVSIPFSASCLSLCQTMSFLLFLLILQCIVCLNYTSSPIARPFCSTSRLLLFSVFGHILLHGSCSSSPSHLLPGPQYSFNSLCSTPHLTVTVNSSCSSSFWIFSFMVSYHSKSFHQRSGSSNVHSVLSLLPFGLNPVLSW